MEEMTMEEMTHKHRLDRIAATQEKELADRKARSKAEFAAYIISITNDHIGEFADVRSKAKKLISEYLS